MGINVESAKKQLASIKEKMATTQNNVGHTEQIYCEDIHLNPKNTFNEKDDDETIEELAESIKAVGLLHPIVVNKKNDDYYEIISGERRYRAITKYIHWRTIPCMVFDNISEDVAQLKLFIANLAVRDYTPQQMSLYLTMTWL